MAQPFTHIGNDIQELAEQVTKDGSGHRLYRTPKGDTFPSITTVLNLVTEDIIAKWRKRVGDVAANKISKEALIRGSVIHEMIEKYLQNIPEVACLGGQSFNHVLLFKQLKPHLNKIDNIRAQETPLYSDLFRVAGRCDCIADYDGRLSVIDFKGANHAKNIEDIPQYFLQVSFYAYAFFERTGIKIPQVAIIMADEGGGTQVFTDKPWVWWEQLKFWRKKYEDRYGI
jgi:genome maintenance exonuclease 1